ncbi:acetoin ABC transporter permease [Lactiplantibacillus carotarum]|mgnify:CR=1 FL=1|uniref:acetoin ABC transporter permease n=1 Tax=Lactiplantibacillus carotarum TaxID=2993456 RepID=UPI00298EECB2|nr:acetoin ABC transporter permease [Lactiplantibacillus carotarum]
MSNQKLRQLLWRHYRALLLTAMGALILAGLKEGFSVVNQPQTYIAPGAFTLESGGGLRVLIAVAVYFVVGLTVFLHDNWTNFDHYLFALPVMRRRIYRQKMLLLMSTTTVGYVLMQVVYWLTIQSVLPKYRAYFAWGNSWRVQLCSMAALLVLMLIACTFGLWVGHLFASVFAAFIFGLSLIFAYNGIINLIAGVLRVKYRQVDLLNNLDPGTWLDMGVILGAALIIGSGLYWLNRWGFEHLSLENSREFFRFPELRGAVLGFSIVYLVIATSCSEFGLEILGLLTDNYRSSMPFGTAVVMAIVIGYLTWSLGRWFLYRPDRFKDVWTFKKLD